MVSVTCCIFLPRPACQMVGFSADKLPLLQNAELLVWEKQFLDFIALSCGFGYLTQAILLTFVLLFLLVLAPSHFHSYFAHTNQYFSFKLLQADFAYYRVNWIPESGQTRKYYSCKWRTPERKIYRTAGGYSNPATLVSNFKQRAWYLKLESL